MLLVENLEQLLLRNWTSFINIKSFTDYVISLAKNAELQIGHSHIEYPKGIQLKMSRFKLIADGFNVWVEFTIPNGPSETVIGTSELRLTNAGIFEHLCTNATLVRKT